MSLFSLNSKRSLHALSSLVETFVCKKEVHKDLGRMFEMSGGCLKDEKRCSDCFMTDGGGREGFRTRRERKMGDEKHQTPKVYTVYHHRHGYCWALNSSCMGRKSESWPEEDYNCMGEGRKGGDKK